MNRILNVTLVVSILVTGTILGVKIFTGTPEVTATIASHQHDISHQHDPLPELEDDEWKPWPDIGKHRPCILEQFGLYREVVETLEDILYEQEKCGPWLLEATTMPWKIKDLTSDI